jgi:hypothetical protein
VKAIFSLYSDSSAARPGIRGFAPMKEGGGAGEVRGPRGLLP